jgi:hypothetical protein
MKVLVLLVVIVSFGMAASTGDGNIRFVVIGARTADPVDGVFGVIIDEISLLKPDFVINVGDIIDAQAGDSNHFHAQWTDVMNTMAVLDCAKYFVPGGNDVNDELTRAIFEKETGCKRYYSFDKGNCHFIVLDNSMTAWAPLPEADSGQYAWFVNDLEKHKDAGHIFVLLNIPFYLTPLSSGQASAFMGLCLRYRVRAVFNGGLGGYMYLNEDGIDYITVGSSGAAMEDNDAGKGNFFHFLFVTVKGDAYDVAVVKHGGIVYRNVFTGSDYYSIQRAQQEVVSFSGLNIREGAKDISSRCKMTLSNSSADSVEGPLVWQFDSTRYSIAPAVMMAALGAEETKVYDIDVHISDGSQLYPLPRCALEYPYTFGKVCTLNSVLSVKRIKTVERIDIRPDIDGSLDDEAWQRLTPMTYLGDDGGRASSMESTELYLGHDEKNVYVGVCCRESDIGGIRATVQEHDGPTYSDDNIWFFFDVNGDEETYYQLIVNPNGVAFDRACSISEGRVTTDIEWNGPWEIEAGREENAWTLEIRIPKSEITPRNDERWGFNFRRLQTSSVSAAYWTLPFGHTPGNFGIIEFK